MQHPLSRGSFQTLDHVQDGIDRVHGRQRALLPDSIFQGPSRGKLHGYSRNTFDLFSPVDVNTVGVVDGSGQPAFTQETPSILFRSQAMTDDL